jgi:hypothetical protein
MNCIKNPYAEETELVSQVFDNFCNVTLKQGSNLVSNIIISLRQQWEETYVIETYKFHESREDKKLPFDCEPEIMFAIVKNHKFKCVLNDPGSLIDACIVELTIRNKRIELTIKYNTSKCVLL